MVLYLIGLGLGDETDITVKGLEAVKKCSLIFLEYYTSVLGVDKDKLVCSLLLYTHETKTGRPSIFDTTYMFDNRSGFMKKISNLQIEI